MKPVLSVLLVLFFLIIVAHCSPSYADRINKRYYDAWEWNNDDGQSMKTIPVHHKGLTYKNDPCDNKPLWFLKSQAKLGKLSPFYDCLISHGVEKK